MRTSSGRSRRTSGSPPVSRTSSTPRAAKIRVSRAISSKLRISSRRNHSSPSAGMQYVQRKLHLSVTEIRTEPICLPQPSTSGSPLRPVAARAPEGAFGLFGDKRAVSHALDDYLPEYDVRKRHETVV